MEVTTLKIGLWKLVDSRYGANLRANISEENLNLVKKQGLYVKYQTPANGGGGRLQKLATKALSHANLNNNNQIKTTYI